MKLKPEYHSQPITPQIRTQVIAEKQKTVYRILNKFKWKDEDFMEILEACHYWPDHAKLQGDKMEIALALIEFLHADPRTPKDRLPMLQEAIRLAKGVGASKTVSFDLLTDKAKNNP